MKWETVIITQNKRGRTTPYASVGFGRIMLSAAACELLDDFNQYNYAELLKARDNAKKICIGIKFLRESTANTLKVSRKKIDGKLIKGCTIDNKTIVEDLFSIIGTQRKSTRFSVCKDGEAENILIISGD